MALSVVQLIQGLIHGTASFISGLMYSYGYYAIFILMLLEAASLPIPSEVVIPLAGLLAAKGVIDLYLAFIVILVASILGITIDYYLAYLLGKDVVYKHLRAFHVKKEQLESFDRWFERNGPFTVFIGRLLPEIRGLVSLPAGFAMMPLGRFYLYSILGMVLWDTALLSFGYYALNAQNIYVVMVSVALFAIVLYLIYRISIGSGRKRRGR